MITAARSMAACSCACCGSGCLVAMRVRLPPRPDRSEDATRFWIARRPAKLFADAARTGNGRVAGPTRALNDFNNVPAFNPYVYSCYNSQCGATTPYAIADLGYGNYGYTDYGYMGSTQYSSGQYYAIMTGNKTMFNSSTWISWNNTLTFSATQADGRKVATHETGHFEGLGHTGHSPAVMRQGAVTYYALQSDDINGLESFYTGSIPA